MRDGRGTLREFGYVRPLIPSWLLTAEASGKSLYFNVERMKTLSPDLYGKALRGFEAAKNRGEMLPNVARRMESEGNIRVAKFELD